MERRVRRSFRSTVLSWVFVATAGCASSTGGSSDAANEAGNDAASEAGSDAASDAGADVMIACGSSSCSATEICVHTVSGGGPCQQPQDGGCPAGTMLSGSCCISHSESYACSPRPSGCGATLACSCVTTECMSCSCQSATNTQLECGCFFP